jgi:DNA-binding transcriptional LysR family regulator
LGLGFAWFPEDTIRRELASGTLAPLPLREGGERWADLYLVFADRDYAGPGARRLAEIIRGCAAEQCAQHQSREDSGSATIEAGDKAARAERGAP